MKILFYKLIFIIFSEFSFCSKSFSFGFESGNIILSPKDEISLKNKTLNIKVNSYLKLHYIPSLENTVLEQFNRENINIKFNLDDYDVTMQKVKTWANEVEDYLKKLLIDKYQQIMEIIKSKDFSDRNIYLKNSFKLNYEIENQLFDIIQFPKEFESFLYKECFPKAFSQTISNFSHKFLLNLKNFRVILNTNSLIEKHDSDCKNAHQCRISLDYSISKSKIVGYVFEEMNIFIRKEFKVMNLYLSEIPLEYYKLNNEEYLGFFLFDDTNMFYNGNLKKNDLEKFFIFTKTQNYNYYNNKDVWILQNLDNFIKANENKKIDL